MIRSVLAGFLFLFTLVESASAQSCSVPNNIINGSNADATQVMANFNALLSCITSASNPVQQAGRLTYVSPTQVNFAPFNGNQIKINAVLSTIPTGGIAGCSNASVYVNGAANQSVAASTRYYVYAFVNSGTVTCDFSTTTHATSTTTGNAGTEIKSGDDTRSLVGMVYTSSSSQFQQSGSVIGVLSWFNRLGITVSGGTANVSFSNTGALFNIGSAAVFGMLNWANEATFAQFYSASSNSGAWVNLGIGLDGSSGSAATQFSATQLVYGAASSGPATGSATGGGWGNPSEGFHNYWIAAQTAAGTSMTLLNTDAHGYTRG